MIEVKISEIKRWTEELTENQTVLGCDGKTYYGVKKVGDRLAIWERRKR